MFRRSEPVSDRPMLIGEDFDIFPDISGIPAEADDALEPVDEEIEEVAEEEVPPEPTPFQKRMADIPEGKWRLYQVLGGIVIGVMAAMPISFLSRVEGVSSYGLIFSVIIAMLVPTQFEKRAQRRIPRMRVTMLISLTLVFGVYLLYGFVINPGYFEV